LSRLARKAEAAGLAAAAVCILGLVASGPVRAAASVPAAELPAGAREADIDQLAARVRRTFSVPGLAIAIVKDGKTVFAKGYGVREAGKAGDVDADTLFGIGSNTKAFTVAALAMLVDEGKLDWDDKVIDHLPAFRLYDPVVTREFTVRDLLTHRSGLGLGAGDLMLFPHTDFSRDEIIHNLRYLKPATSFRSAFAYDNLLYIVAGQLIPAITGLSWEDFVQSRILDRLATGCVVNLARAAGKGNIASPHVVALGRAAAIAPDTGQALDPAGSIQCGARGMAAWMAVQLDEGRMAGGPPLFSETQHRQMWTPQTIMAASPSTAALTRTHFRDYGLGWTLEDYDGFERVWHTGGLVGMVSYVSLLPEQHVGIVVLTNQQSGGAIASLVQDLTDRFVGAPPRDWIAFWSEAEAKRDREAAAAERAAPHRGEAGAAPVAPPLGAYVGVYHDRWRGDAAVRLTGGHLRLAFSRTKDMSGDLEPFKDNLFIVRWDDRSLAADAWVRFGADFTGAVNRMTLKAISPTTDFSFDFQDLDFAKSAAAPGSAGAAK
jgi:CubicO group peptidase (beta-lactamase class C family)